MNFRIVVRCLEKATAMLRHQNPSGISYSIRRTIKTGTKNQPTLMPVHGFVFDLDGTLTLPVLDFTLLRSNLQCPKGTDILEFCNSKSGKDKEIAFKLVEEFEEEGRQNTKLQPGVFELLKFLSRHGLKRALITRNLQPSVDQFLDLLGDPANYGGPFTHVSSILSLQNQPSLPAPCCSKVFLREREILHHQYLISVAEVQTSPAKHS